MAMNSLYNRGQGGLATGQGTAGHNNAQYLPKLGGAGAGLAGSQAQLPQTYNIPSSNNKHAASSTNMPSSQLHYQQQHLL